MIKRALAIGAFLLALVAFSIPAQAQQHVLCSGFGSGTSLCVSPMLLKYVPPLIPATRIASGLVDDTEYLYLDGVTGPLQGQLAARALVARILASGPGLSGGGDLSADRTFSVVADPDGSIAVGVGGVKVGVLATDSQHGNRGGGALHPVATAMLAGFLSAADKAKIDGLAAGATATPLSAVAPVDVTKVPSEVGVSSSAARADHKHNVATAAPPDVGTANAEGISTSLARADHVHRGPVLQTTGFQLATDQSTNSATLVDMTGATVTLSTQMGTKLKIDCSVSASTTAVLGANAQIVLTIDGSDDIGATQSFPALNAAAQNAAIVRLKTGLAAGAHTVKLRYSTTASTLRVRAMTMPTAEHAGCVVQELLL